MKLFHINVPDRRLAFQVFLSVFLYLSIWTMLRPPFQTPDEFAHAVKAYSLPLQPWIAHERMVDVPLKYINPVLDFPPLHRIASHPRETLDGDDITKMKSFVWANSINPVTRKADTTAFFYPPLYYWAVFLAGQGLTDLFSLTPYESTYAYRIATAFLAAALWTWFFLVLRRKTVHSTAVLLVILLNPMLAFMSSGINPDALLYPMTALVMAYSHDLIINDNAKPLILFTTLCAAGLTKSPGLILFPCIAILCMAAFATNRNSGCRKLALATILSFLCVLFAFYLWAPSTEKGLASWGHPLPMTLWRYILTIDFPRLFVAYWGILGWLDYRLPIVFYALLAILIVANASSTARHDVGIDHGFTWYLLIFSILYSLGNFAVEYRFLAEHGRLLQGRYFLPAALGFAMFMMAHSRNMLKRLMIAYLILFNCLFIEYSVMRYYSGDWHLFFHALPF